MANLPVVIFNFAMSPYENWHSAGLGRRNPDRARRAMHQHRRPYLFRDKIQEAHDAINCIERKREMTAAFARGCNDGRRPWSGAKDQGSESRLLLWLLPGAQARSI
jgi:hypothetical protein